MNTPTTEAGRRLIHDEMHERLSLSLGQSAETTEDQFAERVARIERETVSAAQLENERLRGVMVYLCQEGCTGSGHCPDEFGDDEDSWCAVCVMRAALESAPTPTTSEPER